MEASSSSHPSDSNQPVSSASKFLANLPSRGFLSSTVISSNPGGMRVYISEHDTSPPEGQQIKTNQTNILIRSLQLMKQKGDSSSKDVKGVAATEGSRKRALERAMDGRASCKRNNNQLASGQEGSSSSTTEKDFYSLTVEKLRALLKERGLSPKGKKKVRNRLASIPTAHSEPLIQDELVARLRTANG